MLPSIGPATRETGSEKQPTQNCRYSIQRGGPLRSSFRNVFEVSSPPRARDGERADEKLIHFGRVRLKRWWLPVVLALHLLSLGRAVFPRDSGASKPSNRAPTTRRARRKILVGCDRGSTASIRQGSEWSGRQFHHLADRFLFAGSVCHRRGSEGRRDHRAAVLSLIRRLSGPLVEPQLRDRVTLFAEGPTAAKAAAFTNAYAKALGDYINSLSGSKQQGQLQQIQHTINNLEWEIAANGSKVPPNLTTQLAAAQATQQTLLATTTTTGYQSWRPASEPRQLEWAVRRSAERQFEQKGALDRRFLDRRDHWCGSAAADGTPGPRDSAIHPGPRATLDSRWWRKPPLPSGRR